MIVRDTGARDRNILSKETLKSTSNPGGDVNDQVIKIKLKYRSVLACFRKIWNFWSKLMRNYNEVNAELKTTEKRILFLKRRQVARVLQVNSMSSTEGVDFL